MVIFADMKDHGLFEALMKIGNVDGACGSSRAENFSVRIGQLNLIVLTDVEEFEVWHDTALGLAQIGNVDRETAVKTHRDAIAVLRTKQFNASVPAYWAIAARIAAGLDPDVPF